MSAVILRVCPTLFWAKDARGIELARVCEKCEAEVLSTHRPEVLSDPNYDADEPIEAED